jgi:hypothetical protein
VRVNAISAGPFLTDASNAWSEADRQSAELCRPFGAARGNRHNGTFAGEPGFKLHDRRHYPL